MVLVRRWTAVTFVVHLRLAFDRCTDLTAERIASARSEYQMFSFYQYASYFHFETHLKREFAK